MCGCEILLLLGLLVTIGAALGSVLTGAALALAAVMAFLAFAALLHSIILAVFVAATGKAVADYSSKRLIAPSVVAEAPSVCATCATKYPPFADRCPVCHPRTAAARFRAPVLTRKIRESSTLSYNDEKLVFALAVVFSLFLTGLLVRFSHQDAALPGTTGKSTGTVRQAPAKTPARERADVPAPPSSRKSAPPPKRFYMFRVSGEPVMKRQFNTLAWADGIIKIRFNLVDDKNQYTTSTGRMVLTFTTMSRKGIFSSFEGKRQIGVLEYEILPSHFDAKEHDMYCRLPDVSYSNLGIVGEPGDDQWCEVHAVYEDASGRCFEETGRFRMR